MEQRETEALPPQIEAARQRIERWRKTRVKRGPIPVELWDAAVALAHEYGVYKVSRALRLQYDALKIRLAQLENQGGEAGGGVAGFVEVDGGQLIGEGETSES